MGLEGKVAIVTGGGQGIGEGIVRCLAEEGADIAIVDMNEGTARQVVEAVRALGRKAEFYLADVTSEEQVERVVADILGDFPETHILVNDVGGGVRGKRRTPAEPGSPYTFTDISEDVWDRTFHLNTKSAFLMCREIAPHFRERRYGKIVNIGSRLARIPDTGLFTYCVTKAAVVSFTKLLAMELAPHNINVNCVCPGDVLTPNIARAFEMGAKDNPDSAGKSAEDLFNAVAGPRTALRHIQTAEDMGNATTFLASDDSQNITGQSIYVDGGQTFV